MIGLRELVLVAMVVVALYGRSGVVKSRQFQTIWPWLSPQRRPVGQSRAGERPSQPGTRSTRAGSARKRPGAKLFLLRGNRLFWFLTILAATAVAALIVSRAMILGGASHGLNH